MLDKILRGKEQPRRVDEQRRYISQEVDRLQIRERLKMLDYELKMSPSGSEGARIFLELAVEVQPLKDQIMAGMDKKGFLTDEETLALHTKVIELDTLLANNGIGIGAPYEGFGTAPESELPAAQEPVPPAQTEEVVSAATPSPMQAVEKEAEIQPKESIESVPAEAWEHFGTLEQPEKTSTVPTEAWEAFGTLPDLQEARNEFDFRLAEYKHLLRLYGPKHFISTEQDRRDPNDRGIELITQAEKELLAQHGAYAQLLKDLNTAYPNAGYDEELNDLLNKKLERVHVQNEIWLENESTAVAAVRELPPEKRHRLAKAIALALVAAGLGSVGPYVIPEPSRAERPNEDARLRGRTSSTTPAPLQEVPPPPTPARTNGEAEDPIEVSVMNAPLLDTPGADQELTSVPNPNNV